MSNILIVGGSSGIGLATAKKFAKNKSRVTIASLNAKEKKLSEFSTVDLDFTNEPTVKAFFETRTDFDYIVVSATTPLAIGPFSSLDSATAKKCFEKLWGMRHVILYASQYSKHLQAITLISGAAAEKRGANITYLATLCAAINVFVESLAVELAPLRINAISPGVTQTPLYGNTTRETLQGYVNDTPLKRLSTPDEIADVVQFVTLHPQMTGSIVSVDGGAKLV